MFFYKISNHSRNYCCTLQSLAIEDNANVSLAFKVFEENSPDLSRILLENKPNAQVNNIRSFFFYLNTNLFSTATKVGEFCSRIAIIALPCACEIPSKV